MDGRYIVAYAKGKIRFVNTVRITPEGVEVDLVENAIAHNTSLAQAHYIAGLLQESHGNKNGTYYYVQV